MPKRQQLAPATEDRLASYRGRRRPAVKNSSAKKSWGGYAAATGAAVAGGHSAEAMIVHVVPSSPLRAVATPTTPDEGGLVAIDIDGNGADDVNLFVSNYFTTFPFSGAVGPTSTFSGNVGLALGSAAAAGAAWQAVSTYYGSNLALKLSSGSLVSSSQAFASVATFRSQADGVAFSSGGSTAPVNAGTGYFPNDGTGIAGFQFDRNGQTHFGWIRLAFEENPGGLPRSVEAVEWAYEDEPGRGIEAGRIPEPTGLAMLAAGAAGVATLRRRRAA